MVVIPACLFGNGIKTTSPLFAYDIPDLMLASRKHIGRVDSLITSNTLFTRNKFKQNSNLISNCCYLTCLLVSIILHMCILIHKIRPPRTSQVLISNMSTLEREYPMTLVG